MRKGKVASSLEVIVFSNLALSGSQDWIQDGSMLTGVGEHDRGLSNGLEDGLRARPGLRRFIKTPTVNKITIAGYKCQ